MIDLGQYDALKKAPAGKGEQDKVFAKHLERVRALRAAP